MKRPISGLLQQLRRWVASAIVTGSIVLITGATSADGQDWSAPDAPTRIDEPGRPLGGYPANAIEAHGPSPRTLDEFVSLAERSHPKLRAARAAVEAARG